MDRLRRNTHHYMDSFLMWVKNVNITVLGFEKDVGISPTYAALLLQC